MISFDFYSAWENTANGAAPSWTDARQTGPCNIREKTCIRYRPYLACSPRINTRALIPKLIPLRRTDLVGRRRDCGSVYAGPFLYMTKKQTKVFAGLSGGVDSATSAALLQSQGFDVTGVFIKIWQPEFIECTWREDRLDAMRVAAKLGIPFREIDLSAAYKRAVVETMVGDYARGVTPNPDVLCNEFIKFGSFFEYALREGADKVATGHYAQIEERDGEYRLLRGRDTGKDQSYFLHRLSSANLSKTLFPVGGYEKKEIRALAKKYDLPVSTKPDSQGLCFVGDVSMQDFLARYIELGRGHVIDTGGAIVGEHMGAALYTLGQRHGFTHSFAVPQYVVATDPDSNTITVSPHKDDAMKLSGVLRDIHWINGTPSYPYAVYAQARYRELAVPIELRNDAGNVVAHFSEPHLLSSGQSLVFYENDRCLGGGVIA